MEFIDFTLMALVGGLLGGFGLVAGVQLFFMLQDFFDKLFDNEA